MKDSVIICRLTTNVSLLFIALDVAVIWYFIQIRIIRFGRHRNNNPLDERLICEKRPRSIEEHQFELDTLSNCTRNSVLPVSPYLTDINIIFPIF